MRARCRCCGRGTTDHKTGACRRGRQGAGDDPKFYLPDGDLIKILQANNSQTVSTPFPEMSHGWVSRGDMSDAGTAEQVKSAVGLMQGWFAQHLA